MAKSRNRMKKSISSKRKSNKSSIVLLDTTKLNAVMYKVPNTKVVLNSINMNMTFSEYNNRCGGIASIMKNENWILGNTYRQSNHTFNLYKCDNGSFVELSINNN